MIKVIETRSQAAKMCYQLSQIMHYIHKGEMYHGLHALKYNVLLPDFSASQVSRIQYTANTVLSGLLYFHSSHFSPNRDLHNKSLQKLTNTQKLLQEFNNTIRNAYYSI